MEFAWNSFCMGFGWPLSKQWLQAREEDREEVGRELSKLERSKGVYLSHAIVIFCLFLSHWLQIYSLKLVIIMTEKNGALANFLTNFKNLHFFLVLFLLYYKTI